MLLGLWHFALGTVGFSKSLQRTPGLSSATVAGLFGEGKCRRILNALCVCHFSHFYLYY